MGAIVYYASLDNEKLEQVEIELASVELGDINMISGQAKFDVTFLVKNPSDKTFTVSLIRYQLYGDGKLLGSGQYSTTDIALPGRAVFYPDAEVPLKNMFTLYKTEDNEEIYEDAIEGRIISFSAEGIITAESSWSTIEKEFKSDI